MSKNILKMVLKRFIQSCITILIVTLFVFTLIQLVPGNPVANYLGATATEEQIEYYTHLYGFDRPVIVQYLSWIGGLFRGTMGQSISYQSEIADILLPRLGTTLTMVVPAFILGTVLGVGLGVLAAKKRGTWIDSVVCFFANVGVSMPLFWLGMVGMLVLGLKLHLLPTSGYVPPSRDFGEWLRHMIMPIIIQSLGVMAGFMRLARSSMLEVIRQDYVTTARAKGVNNRDITVKHQLRNALIPIVTAMGSRLGMMVGSTVLIESLFVIPGLGSVMMNGISNRDFMLVANGVLIISIFVALCNLVVDILYGFIDPRTK
ncbi:MAG: ABC transporter permease [Lachnospiraceae bacterium]|nr:ABC transporter permease [Lachnospiraceae bacterium]